MVENYFEKDKSVFVLFVVAEKGDRLVGNVGFARREGYNYRKVINNKKIIVYIDLLYN